MNETIVKKKPEVIIRSDLLVTYVGYIDEIAGSYRSASGGQQTRAPTVTATVTQKMK